MQPNYPQIILSFAYRDCKVEIDRDESNGHCTYAAWVNYDQGCAVAVPRAFTTKDAIRQAKKWIDQKRGSVQ